MKRLIITAFSLIIGFSAINAQYIMNVHQTDGNDIKFDVADVDEITWTSRPPVPVTGVSLNNTQLELTKGSSTTLVATVTPSNATVKKVSWKSSDSKVAIVDSNGNVAALSAGTTTITVTTEDGGKTASCLVNVSVPITGITLNANEITLYEGESVALIPTIQPADATDAKIVWSSDNNNVSVDQNGYVKVLGKSQIGEKAEVTANVGDCSAKCSVNIKTHVSDIKLDKQPLILKINQKEKLTASIIPSFADDQSMNWKSSDESVANVDGQGNVQAFGKSGQTVITVTSADGNHQAECVAIVLVPVSEVCLSQTEIQMIPQQEMWLVATINPSDATNKNVSWKSSDNAVATVDANGKVTAVGSGKATITVTTEDGGKTAECSVTVTIPVTGVSLNYTNRTLERGSSTTLKATVIPSDATNKNVSWKSTDNDVATVDGNGKVKAVGKGDAIITVTTEDGGKIAICTVKVFVMTY